MAVACSQVLSAIGLALGTLVPDVIYAYAAAVVTEFHTTELREFARARMGFLLRPMGQRAKVVE